MNIKYLVLIALFTLTAHTLFGITPIGQAALNGDVKTIQQLIDNKQATVNSSADENEPNATLINASLYGLMYSYEDLHKNGLKETIKFLLENGASPKIQSHGPHGGSSLWYPIHNVMDRITPKKRSLVYRDILKLLLQHNVDTNVTNLDGDTPLHIAIQNDAPDIVELLLDYGAKTDIENKEGMTAYAIAVKNNNQKIKEIFGQHKMRIGFAKIKQKSTKGDQLYMQSK